MKILVIGFDALALGIKNQLLWDILDEAKDAGVSYTKTEYSIDNPHRHKGDYDAYIWVDIEDGVVYFDKPFIQISSLLDSDDDVVNKVTDIAEWIFGKKEWTPPDDVTPDSSNENDPDVDISELIVDIKDLGYQISDEEIEKMVIKDFIISVEGRDVCIPKQDIVALSKVANLMDKFGYKVKRVIV